jgi:hypothetical protein
MALTYNYDATTIGEAFGVPSDEVDKIGKELFSIICDVELTLPGEVEKIIELVSTDDLKTLQIVIGLLLNYIYKATNAERIIEGLKL